MNTHRIFILVVVTIAMCLISASVGAASEVNLTLEGHFGGTIESVAISNNYASFGMGQDLVVLEVSEP